MQKFNLSPYLTAIKTNLKTINRGEGDCLNRLDGSHWQRVLADGNVLSLNLSTGELQATKDISLAKVYALLGLQDKQFIFAEYKHLFTAEQYQALQRFQYMSVPQYDTMLEGLTQIVFGQQIAVSVANKQRINFVKSMGKQYGENLYQYPKLENITETAVNQLSISTNKKKSLLEIKEYFTHSAADTTNLINIFGVGNWTVDWFALKCLNKTNTIPAGDLKVRKTFSKFFNDEKYTDSKQLKVLEEKLYPIGGLLAHCLLLEFS